MAFHFSKVVQEFLYPFNVALLLLAAALWWQRSLRRTRGWRATAAALAVLVVTGMPAVSDQLMLSVETYYPSRPVGDYPAADAIVVLGGTTPPTRPPRYEAEELNGSRMLQAARLLRRGKALFVVVTGGLSYAGVGGATRTEADDMRDVLLDMGVDAARVVTEGQSRNTYENAVNTAAILKSRDAKSILLVTSAFHMRRSVALFAKQGFAVTAVPTGHAVADSEWALRRFLPIPNGVARTTSAVKEHVGYWAYRLWGKL